MSTDASRFRRLATRMKPDALGYGIALVAAPLTAVLTVLQPWLMKRIIDDHIAALDLAGAKGLALVYLGLALGAFLLEGVYALTTSWAAMRTITRLRVEVFQHTLTRSLSVFDTQPTGKLLTRATSDVEALGETLTSGAISIVIDALMVVGILGMMFSLDAKLTFILLLIAPPLAMFLEGIRRVLRKLYQEIRTAVADLNAFTAERLAGIEVVQLYTDEARTLEGYRERNTRYRDATVRTNVWDALLYAVVDGLTSMTMALLLWYAASDWLGGIATAGLLAAFIDLIGKLFGPIKEFSQKLAVIQRASSALEKIFGILDLDDEISAGTVTLEGPPSRVVLQDLGFAYRDGPPVLRGINLEVSAGEVVALVGRTGSGKSTLGKLLLRAYDGYSGSIRLGDHELSQLTPSSVRSHVGMVHQDVQIFPGDVRFNIALGADISDVKLLAAIEMAHATDVVERLGGLDGRLEAAGRNVSVGEAQLLSFARTLAHDPPLVILDEATASVDTLTEARIQAATKSLLHGRTVLVVAHRLSTITGSDRIVLLDAGQVGEVGTHAELLAMEGSYASLFRDQFHDHGSVAL